MRELLSSKIHNATVTMACLDYIGSVTIDPLLIERANLWPGQKVLVVSHKGARLETYVIVGEHPGNGEICMNGPAAHLISQGDRVIIMGFEFSSKPVQPAVILVDANNQFERYLHERPNMTAAEAPAFNSIG
jgi:aspartate 1-decarboxylase